MLSICITGIVIAVWGVGIASVMIDECKSNKQPKVDPIVFYMEGLTDQQAYEHVLQILRNRRLRHNAHEWSRDQVRKNLFILLNEEVRTDKARKKEIEDLWNGLGYVYRQSHRKY